MAQNILLSKEDTIKITKEIKTATRHNHRRIIVLTGKNEGNIVIASIEILYLYVKKFCENTCKILYVYNPFYDDGVARRNMFEKGVKGRFNVEYVPFHECDKILGQTYDLTIIDFINNLEPNDIGKLAGIVKGGGLYIFMLPIFDVLLSSLTRFQTLLITPQYKPENIRHLFARRFIKKLYEHYGIAINDVDKKIFIQNFREYSISKKQKQKLIIPKKTRIPQIIYENALTQDQIDALRLLETLYTKPEKEEKKVIVLTADRGRGKSSVIGLAIGGLAHKIRRAKGKCKILVTASSETNVQEVFKFAKKALELLGHEVKISSGQYITSLRSKNIEIEFSPPLNCIKKQADILVVDEAAALHVPMLFAFLKKFNRIVYSSTIHGYEGSGRGFSIRFLTRLRKLKNVKVIEYEMNEPIRYSSDDPIEKWVFDFLLLDAEPAKLDQDDIRLIENKEVQYFVPKLKKFFLEQEEMLRQFVGIYVMAHYRNNPNDLGMMMDAPHHFVRAVILPTNKIVVSLEVAEEGPLNENMAKECAIGAWILGNIIPDRLIKHYKIIDFGKFKGLRIVRIATHPDVMRKGLGSIALKFLEEEAKEKGYDWIGAGFGVTRELLNFWLKNGYIPVHLSPERNVVSGEYSLLVIKPLNEKAKKYINVFSKEFLRKLIYSLPEPYHDLNPNTARILLNSTNNIELKLELSPPQIGRFMSYAWGDMTLENCMDTMQILAKKYFMMKDNERLSELQELLLITKILQAKSWRVTCNELNIIPPKAMEELRKIAQIFARKFFGIKNKEESINYLFLKLDKVLK